MRIFWQFAATLVLAMVASTAIGLQPPARTEFPSRNGSFVLDVNPESGVYTIYAVNNRATPMWSYRSPIYYWHYLVADDGSTVVGVLDAELPKGPVTVAAISFWNQSGATQAYIVDELCPNPPRVWVTERQKFANGTVRWRDAIAMDGTMLNLTTARGVRYEFRLSDGAITSRVEPMVTTRRVLPALLVLAVVLGFAWYSSRRRRMRSPLK